MAGSQEMHQVIQTLSKEKTGSEGALISSEVKGGLWVSHLLMDFGSCKPYETTRQICHIVNRSLDTLRFSCNIVADTRLTALPNTESSFFRAKLKGRRAAAGQPYLANKDGPDTCDADDRLNQSVIPTSWYQTFGQLKDKCDDQVGHFFQVEPWSGTMASMAEQQLTIIFCPLWITTVHAQLLITTDAGTVQAIQLVGSCHRLNVSLEPKAVDLTNCVAGKVCRQTLRLINKGHHAIQYSVVEAEELTKQAMDALQEDKVYVRPSQGVVQAAAEALLDVCYLPSAQAGDFSRFFALQIPGEVPFQVRVFGHTLAAAVQVNLPAIGHPHQDIRDTDFEQQGPDDEAVAGDYALQDSTDVICVPQRTRYVLDFGFLGISSPTTARLIHVLNLGEDFLTFSLKPNNDWLRKKLTIDFNRHNRLPPRGLALIRFVLNPADYPLGRSSCTVSFNTNCGPTFSVLVKVCIEEPQLAVRVRCPTTVQSHRSTTICCQDVGGNLRLPTVNFGLVRCGHLAKMTIHLINNSRLSSLWRAHDVDFDTIREGKRLAPKERQALKDQRSLLRVFAFQPYCGTLQPGQCSNHEVSFEPQEDREYKYGWRLEIAHSQQVVFLQAQGRGIRPEVELSTSVVHFDSVVPYAGGGEKQLWLYNPCPFPIDLFCRELDPQYVLETYVLQQVQEFQTMEKVRFPLRRLGGSLPGELLEAYRSKTGRPVMSQTGEVVADVPAVKELVTSQAANDEGAGITALLKQRLDTEAFEQQMGRSFGTKRELYHALHSALQTPLEKALVEYDHFSPITRNTDKKGVVVIIHGPPSCGKTTLATRLSHFYQLPLLHIDQIIMEAIQNPTEAIHHKILNFLVNPSSVTGSGLPGAVRSLQTPPDVDSRLRDKNKANPRAPINKPAKSAVGHNKGLNAANDPLANKERDPDLPFVSKLIRYRSAQTKEMSELSSAVIPEDLLGQLITWRLQQPDCCRGVVFDDLQSDFTDNYPSTLKMLLAVVANRQRVYSYILLNSFRQFRQRRMRQRRSHNHGAYAAVLRRMNGLRTLSEGHYRQLPRSTKAKTSLAINAYVDTLRMMRDQRQRHRATEPKQPVIPTNKDTLGPKDKAGSRAPSSHKLITASESGSVTPAIHKDMQSLETMSMAGGRSIIRAAASARNLSVYKTKSNKPGTSHPATSAKDNGASRSKRDYWSMQPSLKEDGVEVAVWKSNAYRSHKAFFSTLKECCTLINEWTGENKQDTKRASQKSDNLNKDISGTIPVTTINQKKRTVKGKEVRARTKESSEAERAAKDKVVIARIKARYASKRTFGVKLILLYRKYTCNGDDRLVNLDDKQKSHRWWYLPDLAVLQAVTKAQLPLSPAQTYVLRSRPFVPVLDQGVSPDSPFHFVGEGSLAPSTSPPLGAKISQYVAVSSDRVPSAQPKDPPNDNNANKPKGNTLGVDRSRTAAKSAVKQRLPGSAMNGREPGASGTNPEVKAGKDDLSILYPTFMKARKASEPDSKPLTNFRWSLLAHEKMYLRVNFHSNKEGSFKERYNFEIVDYAAGSVALDVNGQCQYPNLFGELSDLFPAGMCIAAIQDERKAPVFVTTDQKLFFGPLLVGKKKSDVLADKWSQNVVVMTVRNTSKRALNAHFNIVKHAGNNPKDAKWPTLDFSILPERFKVPGESEQVVRFFAHPAAVGRCEDTVLAFTEFNPAPVQFTLSALCIKPQAEVVLKNVMVEKVPLREMAIGAIELRNKQGLVPVRWKLVGVDTLPPEFTFEAREGVLKATAQIQSIPVKFMSSGEKPVVHSKKPLKIEFSTDEPESTVLQTESLTISGESYDLILDITFPKMAEPILDFGVCKVKEEVTRQMTIKNKSKSDCAFQLVLALDEIIVPSYPAAQLSDLLEFQPPSGTLSGTERPMTVNVVFRPLAEIEVKQEKLVKCLVLDPSRGNQRVAEIPIKTILAARYSRFVLNPPAGHMRFACSTPGQKRSRTITIQNSGDFDIQYSFKKLVSHVQNAVPPRIDTPTLGKNLGGINSAVMAKASTASTHSNKKGEGASSLLNSAMPFIVKPQAGTIKVGDTAQISVEFGSDLVGNYDESHSLELSDRNPLSYPDGLTYHFSGEVASPTIDSKNIEDIFFEHRVLPHDVLSVPDSTLSQWLLDQSVYLPKRKHFFVQHTLVGTKRHLRFKLSNPTNLTTVILVRLQPAGSSAPSTGAPSSGKGGAPAAAAIKANVEGFSISGSNTIVIEPHRHAFLTLIYAPLLTNKYHIVCDISIELSGPPTIRLAAAMTFDIFAEGILPNLRFGLPAHLPTNSIPRSLYFYNTPVGQHHDLPLVIHNDTVIPVEASLSLTVSDGIFAILSNDDTSTQVGTMRCQMGLAAKDFKQFLIRFRPDKLGSFKRYLELSCRESACPDNFLLLVGAAVPDDKVYLDQLPAVAYDERARLISATEMNLEEVIRERYHLGFGDVCPGQTQLQTFDIVNRSSQWVRYEWTSLGTGLAIMPKSGHLKPETAAHLQAKLHLADDAPARHNVQIASLQLSDIIVDDKYDAEAVWNSDRQVLQVVPENSKPNGEGETSQLARSGDHGESDSDEHSKEGNKHETRKDPKKTLNAKTPSKDKKPTKKESISSDSKGARKGTSKRRTSDQRKAADHVAAKGQIAPAVNNPQTEPSSHKVPVEDDKLKLAAIAQTPSSVPPAMEVLPVGQTRVQIPQSEPIVVVQTNTQRSLPVVVSGTVGYASYECETQEILLRETNVLEERRFTFNLKNTGLPAISYSAQFCTDNLQCIAYLNQQISSLQAKYPSSTISATPQKNTSAKEAMDRPGGDSSDENLSVQSLPIPTKGGKTGSRTPSGQSSTESSVTRDGTNKKRGRKASKDNAVAMVLEKIMPVRSPPALKGPSGKEARALLAATPPQADKSSTLMPRRILPSHFQQELTSYITGYSHISTAFHLTPLEGTIAAGATQAFSLSFRPEIPGEYLTAVLITIANQRPQSLPLFIPVHATAKLPILHISSVGPDGVLHPTSSEEDAGWTLHFDVIGTEGSVHSVLYLDNPTDQSYHFNLSCLDHDDATKAPFEVSAMQGTVAAGKRTLLTVTFCPYVHGTFSSRWLLNLAQYPLLNFSLTFSALVRDAEVTWSPRVLSFKPMLPGLKKQFKLQLSTTEQKQLRFQMDMENFKGHDEAQWSVVPMKGVISPGKDSEVEVTVVPTKAFTTDITLLCRVEKRSMPLQCVLEHQVISPAMEFVYLPVTDSRMVLHHVGSKSEVNQVHLGPTEMHSVYRLSFQLTNTGPVNAAFTASLQNSEFVAVNTDRYLTLSLHHGKLTPGQGSNLILVYSPTSLRHQIKGIHFVVEIEFGPRYVVRLNGELARLAVEYSFDLCDFGTVLIAKDSPKYGATVPLIIANRTAQTVNLDLINHNLPPAITFEFTSTKLAAGNSAIHTCLFRPTVVGPCTGSLTFLMNGTVTKSVELKGHGVPLHVEVPSRHRHLVFKNAKVGVVSTLSFSVINRSLVEINGHVVLLPVTSLSGPQLKTLLDSKEVWLAPHSSVIIAVGQSIEASINFKPAARITGFDARLCFVTDQHVIVELASVNGKCDGLDIVLDEQTVDFGAVVLGGWVKRNLLLRSQGELGAYFAWDTALLAPHYTIKPDKGYIPAKGQLLLEVIFTPAFLSSDIRVLDIQCNIPQNKSPVKLNVIGACLPPVLPKEVFNFECPVRESDRKQLTITNTTATPWNLKPQVSNPVWSVPQQVTVRANGSEHFEAIFRPIESKPQQGLVTLILPAGQSQVFSLAGKTLPPKPNGRIGKEVPCRTPHKELLLVNNWLQKSQSFTVTFEYVKPDKVDPAIELTGNSMVHVPPMGHSQYELTFKALRDRDVNAVYTYKIVFKNADGEYQYYDIQYKVGRGPMYDSKTITAPVRTSRKEVVKVVNPLETNVTISCQLQGVAGEITLEPSIPTLIPGKKEMDLVVEYFPLKPGSTQGRIDIGSTELGIFSVELNLHATLPKPEPPVTFAASLGGTASQICTLRNHSRSKADFAVKIVEGATEFQLINEKSVYSLPPGSSHNPTEMNLDIMFDPIKLGKSRGRLVASSASGAGEFVFILEGTCLRPQPRGPFALQSPATDLQPPLEFRNPFARPCSFKVSSSNRAFQVRENTDIIKGKKTAGIGVSFNPTQLALDGETAKENSLLSQITVIPVFEGVPPVEEVAEWVYYIKCTL